MSSSSIRAKIPKTHSARPKKVDSAYRRIFILVTLALAFILALYVVVPKSHSQRPPKRESAIVNNDSPISDYSQFWDKEVLTPGDGTTYPKKGDTVTIHYTGLLDDGTEFDSSVKRGEPFKTAIGVGRVIPGWDESVPMMSLGEKAKLTIAHQAAYGEQGVGPIPPKATLNFIVELLGINENVLDIPNPAA
ncbi:hypothetical protein BC832DRAFT_562565 [Gaertneriomyces semiglobifer]|nr:hypothetical protein BC832DRAFT_562565 [Gaertneriomyces semiglobifer]